MKGALVIEDGTVVKGEGFGSEKTVFGELVFNTNMTGYQEALTDPSYKGQILMMTYPLIGNYGVSERNFESNTVQPEGFVVSEQCLLPSHRRSLGTISKFLKDHDSPGIADVDTRALTIKIRKHGTMKAALATSQEEIDLEGLIKEVRRMQDPNERNLVKEVSCKEPIPHDRRDEIDIVLIDCGVKASIIKSLWKRCNVIQVPYDTSPEEIMAFKPSGVVVSNGPGDPSHPEIRSTTVKTLKEIVNDVPTMGICLGHQLLSLVFGAETFKLKFGHRGGNQPVKDLESGRVYITSQNHGFAVTDNRFGENSNDELIVTQVNVNDDTVEGMKHSHLPVFSVQYHPEASPGPRDSQHLFDEFISMIKGG